MTRATSASPSYERRMRSAMSRPADLRSSWMRRTSSRARPSSASAGVVSVAPATAKPAPPAAEQLLRLQLETSGADGSASGDLTGDGGVVGRGEGALDAPDLAAVLRAEEGQVRPHLVVEGLRFVADQLQRLDVQLLG